MKNNKTVIVLSVSSDIGLGLAKRYLVDEYTVIGTYRQYGKLNEINAHPRCHLLFCDVSDERSIRKFLTGYKQLHLPWETVISCIGDPRPLVPFFTGDFAKWYQSICVNALDQLRLVHGLYPLRIRKTIPNIVLFSAGGVMKPVRNFSAYTISKILLIKMCEYLAAENPRLNVFTVGPGWTKTKIHDLIINDPHVSKEMRNTTKKFLQSKEGTSMQDIYDCIRWLCSQEPAIVSGRNFFIPQDPWKRKGKQLVAALEHDPDMYTLRRYKNEWGRKK